MGEPGTAPAILVVQPDEELRPGLVAELVGRYGRSRVLAVATAADALAELADRRADFAVVVTDARLPGGSGRELLAEVRQRHPGVGRVLMAASYVTRPEHYDESDLVREALAGGDAQAVVSRPWHPATDRLFPPLDDLLADWAQLQRQRVQTLTIICDVSSARGHEIRDLLTRNGLPHEWLDPASLRGARLLRQAASSDTSRPVLFLHNGAVLIDPTNRGITAALGVATKPSRDDYDLLIIGVGPAGLAAAVYGASEGLTTLGIEAQAYGGQAGTTSRIENYLGFPAGISGTSLMQRATLQAGRLGAEALIPQRAIGLSRADGRLTVALEDGQRVRGRAVVLATGVEYRRLSAPGVERLVGAGVHYGSPTVELPGVAGGTVFVVGGGNSAGQAAVRLAQSAAQVTLVVRGPSLTAGMSHYLVEQLTRLPNVEVRTGTQVTGCLGSRVLEAVQLTHSSGDTVVLPAAALFVMIGAVPRTDWLSGEVHRDERGFVLTGPDLLRDGVPPPDWPLRRGPFLLETSLPYVFAVGDVRHRSIKRVASAVGEGSSVVSFVHAAIREQVEPASH